MKGARYAARVQGDGGVPCKGAAAATSEFTRRSMPAMPAMPAMSAMSARARIRGIEFLHIKLDFECVS